MSTIGTITLLSPRRPAYRFVIMNSETLLYCYRPIDYDKQLFLAYS